MAFVSVPPKTTDAVDFTKDVSRFIKTSYGDSARESHESAITELNQLRANAVCKPLARHESGLEIITRYYDQLRVMEGKLPLTETQIRVKFTWYDALDKGSMFGSVKCSLYSGIYERCCVLFNIAAQQGSIASIQNLDHDDSIKMAAKYFQAAASSYSSLKELITSSGLTCTTPDMSVDMLDFFHNLMLAQAQECFCIKAVNDKMKDVSVAKLAIKTSNLYKEVSRIGSVSHLKSSLAKLNGIQLLPARSLFFKSLSDYRLGIVAETEKRYGEAVSYLQAALSEIKEAMKVGGNDVDYRSFCDKVSSAYASAKKDNDIIYLACVPNINSLPAVDGILLAKTSPLPPLLSSTFKDLFLEIMPVVVHQAMSDFKAVLGERKQGLLAKISEANCTVNSILSAFNLPAALEDVSNDQVPSSILEKMSKFRAYGGVKSLDRQTTRAEENAQQCIEIMDETMRMLDEEEKEDSVMRAQFSTSWDRSSSCYLTVQFREELKKNSTKLTQAQHADKLVRSLVEENRKRLELLGMTEAEIIKVLPKAGGCSSGDTTAVATLRDLLKRLDGVKLERAACESKLQDLDMDITQSLLASMNLDGTLHTDAVFAASLDSVFPLIEKQLGSNLKDQEQLLGQIQEANTRFVSSRNSSADSNHRGEFMKDLAVGFDSFTESVKHISDGIKFYQDMSDILLVLQSKVSDYSFARRTEKDELARELSSSRSTSSSTTQQGSTGKTPERPPKPTTGFVPSAPVQTPSGYGGAYVPNTAPPPQFISPGQQPMGFPPSYNMYGYQPPQQPAMNPRPYPAPPQGGYNFAPGENRPPWTPAQPPTLGPGQPYPNYPPSWQTYGYPCPR